MAAPDKIVTAAFGRSAVALEGSVPPPEIHRAGPTFRVLAFRLQRHAAMGDGFRSRIWTYLDDPEFGRHEGLRNALYRLLVASEIPIGSGAAGIDAGCLDVAAAAVREKNPAVIARACDLVDDLVVRLATLAA